MTNPDPQIHPLAQALAAPLAALRDGLDVVRSVSMTLSRLMGRAGEPGSAAAEPLSRLRTWVMAERPALVAAMQARDALDQRSDHILAILRGAVAADEAGRTAAEQIAVAQLGGVADLLLTTAQTVGGALTNARRHLVEAGTEHAPEGALDTAQSGLEAVSLIGREAAALQDLCHANAAPMPQTPVDLAWVAALYTMDAEREIHTRVVRAATPRVALRA